MYFADFYFGTAFFESVFPKIEDNEECYIIYGKAVATTVLDIFGNFNSFLANLLKFSRASTDAYSVSLSSSETIEVFGNEIFD